MKTKDRKELHTKTVQELKTQLAQAQKELFSLRLEKAQSKLKNTSLVRTKQKDIARVITILKDKELAHENA